MEPWWHTQHHCLQQVISLSWCATRQQLIETARPLENTAALIWVPASCGEVAGKASESKAPAQGTPFHCFSYVLCKYAYMRVYMCTHTGHGPYVEVRRQLFLHQVDLRIRLGASGLAGSSVLTGPSCWLRDPPPLKSSKDIMSSK